MLGFGFALYCASLFGSIPYLVEAKVLGTAFGIRTVSENIGLFLTPILIGELLSNSKSDDFQDYTAALGTLAVIAIAGLFMGVWIYEDDIRNRGGVLESPDHIKFLVELVDTPIPGREMPLIMISHLTSSQEAETSFAALSHIET